MSPLPADLWPRSRPWIADDPDTATAAELTAGSLLQRPATRTWPTRSPIAFAGTLQFGTAGLRGKLGPGPNRMNRVVVSRAAAGLAQYLLDRGGRAPRW